MAGKLNSNDPLTTIQRSALMSKVKSRGNRSTEIAVEEALIGRRIRDWVKHPDTIAGKPDFFFPKYGLAVFVDGCFWHCCPTCTRNLPTNRRIFWARKIGQNLRRDNRVRGALRREGYSVMRIWEHSIGNHHVWLGRLTRMLDRRDPRKISRRQSDK